MAKTPKESDIKLADVLPAIDQKDIDWWDTLNPKQQEKFPSWLYMRYTSLCSSNNPDIQRYYLIAVNKTANRHFNSVRKHLKLQYLLLTASSPGIGNQFHKWLAPPSSKTKNNSLIKALEKIYPTYSKSDLNALAQINDEESIRGHLEAMGWSDKEINEVLKNNE